MKTRTERDVSLDLIRILAAFLVFLYHLNMELSVRGAHGPFIFIDAGANIEMGQLGTVLFMILSGFTSAMSYEKLRSTDHPVKTYYRKRLKSILPMFYAAYLLAFTALRLPDRSFDHTLLYTLFGMDGYLAVHGVRTCYLVGEWFTGCILLMYLLFPLLYSLSEKGPLYLLTGAILLKAAAILLILKTGLTDNDLLFYLPDFILGCLSFRCLKKIPALGGIVSVLLFLLFTIVRIPVNYRIMISFQGFSLFLALRFLAGTLTGRRKSGNSTRIRDGLRTIAKYTYAVFLTHHVVIGFVLKPVAGMIGKGAYLKLFLTALFFTALMSFFVEEIGEGMTRLLTMRRRRGMETEA